jgi:parallel beta-helix repeat protein
VTASPGGGGLPGTMVVMNATMGIVAAALGAQPALPLVTVTRDDTVISTSCRVVIPPGVVIPDANGDGVIHIRGDGITVEFAAGSWLDGGAPDTPPDRLTGIGVRLDGHRGVTIRGGRVRGYKVGLHASRAPGLTIDGAEVTGCYRQRLRSTPAGEDGADWLWPHKNDHNEWMTNYGAAVVVEDSDGVTVRGVRVRRGQNGIVLDRVNESRVYDNDCSFLSGWGLAMWRSCRNTVSRNAFDFCVRGHVEGVYNRGQDSAGILFFEQNCENVIAENSVTHGGDGFFAFAGLEALNGEGAPPGYDHTRKGCNDNLIVGNDFSYAPAHGIELTFSFGNRILRNRLVENAICGVWGGYSQETLIAENTIEGNGGMGYGLERGGVNIEHGSGNLIVNNTFVNNRCGVHLWWDAHGDFAEKTWGKANYKGVTGNIVAGNTFEVNSEHPFRGLNPQEKLITLHLRDDGQGNVRGTGYFNNTVRLSNPQAVEVDGTPGIEIVRAGRTPAYDVPRIEVPGRTRPVGARPTLRGRRTPTRCTTSRRRRWGPRARGSASRWSRRWRRWAGSR